MAILVGDALLTEAFHVMATARGVPPERAVRVIGEVAAAASEGGMVGGQALDLAAAGRAATLARVREIHRWKTGALLRVAVRAGALVGGAEAGVLRRLTQYGEHLGLAFQIADDVLDAAERPEGDGRTDRALGKATYPAVLGLEGARRAALRERDDALTAVRPLGPTAEPLRAIAEYVVARAGLVPAGSVPAAPTGPPVPLARLRRAAR
jgi:geranylgeranyl pyrophosphate synthase